MNDLASEIIKALIWSLAAGVIGTVPILFGLAVHMWADIRSVKKSLNAAFKKIRAIEGEEDVCSRE